MQPKGGEVMQTSPNPFTANLDIRFTAMANAKAEVAIINTNGQQVLVKQTEITKGYVTIQLDGLSKLAPGMYIATLKIDGVTSGTQKIIKN